MSSVADTKTRDPGDFSSSSRKWRLPPLPRCNSAVPSAMLGVWAALPPLSLRSAMLRSPAPLRPPRGSAAPLCARLRLCLPARLCGISDYSHTILLPPRLLKSMVSLNLRSSLSFTSVFIIGLSLNKVFPLVTSVLYGLSLSLYKFLCYGLYLFAIFFIQACIISPRCTLYVCFYYRSLSQ